MRSITLWSLLLAFVSPMSACAGPSSSSASPDDERVDTGSAMVGTGGGSAPDADDPQDPPNPSGDDTPLPAAAVDPRDAAQVYFVGHSLISHRDMHRSGAQTIPELVEAFANASNVGHGSYLHTTPGAPLSWNWNEVADRRQELESNAGRYDTMVLTEGIFLDPAYRWHRSPFYARRFFCTLAEANPDAELYVYETWHHLYGSDPNGDYPEPHVYDWRERLDEDRPRWERIADEAATGETPRPDGAFYQGAGDCDQRLRVRLIPAGTALAALYDRLESGEEWGGLTVHDLFQNGYTNWPEDWPVDERRAGSVDWRSRMSDLQTAHPGPLDDIHQSAIMAYYVGLVMYATVYRRSPVGLPALNGIDEGVARQMQELVWSVVTNDPRSGVSAP